MTLLSRLRSFLGAAFNRSRLERDLREEWTFHIDRRVDELIAGGMTAAAARAAAEREFGNPLPLREASRDARGLRLLDELLQDVRFAVRLMWRAPGFTAAAVLSLALGIGANTAIFSLIDAVLMRTVPVAGAEALYFLAHGDGDRVSSSSNYPLFDRYLEGTTGAFEAITAYTQTAFKVAGSEGPELVSGQYVSGNYHHVLGVPMALGHGFAAESDRDTGAAPIAVISDAYWARRFGRSPSVLHETLQIDGRTVAIVGVTAAAFTGFIPGTAMDITLPIFVKVMEQPGYLTMHDTWTNLTMVARLRAGTGLDGALAVTDAVFQRYMAEPENAWPRKDFPAQYKSARLMEAGRGTGALRREYERSLTVLMAMVGLVLLMASLNVANLLLARGTARSKEMAVRLCVGGGRARLVRQLLTESLVLACIGGAVGVALSIQGVNGIVSMLAAGEQPLEIDVALNGRVLAFTLAVSLLTGVVFGLWPAWKATALELTPALKENPGAAGRLPRWIPIGKVLVAVQMAVAVMVVAVAGLLVRSLYNLRTAPAGFDPASVVLFIADAERAGMKPEPLAAFQKDLLDRLQVLPGVQSVSGSWTSPLNSRGNARALIMPDRPQTFEELGVFVNVVTPGYFRTLGIRLLRGRLLAASDTATSLPVIVVNETVARSYFGQSDPVGRTLRFRSQPDRDLHIVGVVADVAQYNLRDPIIKMGFVPHTQNADPMRHLTVAMKTAGDAAGLAATFRHMVRALNPEVMVRHVRTMDEDVAVSLKRERLLANLSSGFAALALLLAAVGLYGVISFDVVRRRREIGVRMALGAGRRTVLTQVMRHTLLTAGAGVALGLGLAWYGTATVTSLLWGLSPRDPATLVTVTAILAATAMLAGYLPARRAARLDPMQVLRSE